MFKKIEKQLPQLTTLDLQYVSPELLKARSLELGADCTERTTKKLMTENDEYLYGSLSRGPSRSEFTARKNYRFAEVFFDAPGNERDYMLNMKPSNKCR